MAHEDKPLPEHTPPDGVDDATLEAVGLVTEALETTERARGRLYDFHQLTGSADLKLGEAEKVAKAISERQKYFEDHLLWLKERFPNGTYNDVTGLCKAATIEDIEEQDWSLNPARYVGVVIEEDGLTKEDFIKEIKETHSTLDDLKNEAARLEKEINEKILTLL